MKMYVGLVVLALALVTGCGEKTAPQLSLGDKVIVEPGQLGIIIDNWNGVNGWSYHVMIRDRKFWVKESELQLYQLMNWNEFRTPVIPKCILDAPGDITIPLPEAAPPEVQKPSKPIKSIYYINPLNMYNYKDIT